MILSNWKVLSTRLFLLLFTITLFGCGSMAKKVASGLTNSQLNGTLNKSYDDVIYEHPNYGKLVGREKLANGDTIMKHVGDFGEESSSVGGVYGKKNSNARVIYFRVSQNGLITDWATEFFQAGSQKCWVGICGSKEHKQVPITELDNIVKTSAGTSISAWRS